MITLDPTSVLPPYEQVRSQIAEQIADRRLVAGTRLPTVRHLAEQLGLAANTVARAYRELEVAGMVETKGRAGTVVSARGNHSLEQLGSAAGAYARLAVALGVGAAEATSLVHAAFGAIDATR